MRGVGPSKRKARPNQSGERILCEREITHSTGSGSLLSYRERFRGVEPTDFFKRRVGLREEIGPLLVRGALGERVVAFAFVLPDLQGQ